MTLLFRWLSYICIILCPIIAGHGQAASLNLPLTISYQGSPLDNAGSPLPDGPTDVEFLITDGADTTLFTDSQKVEVINGAINALIGTGSDPATGETHAGIPAEIFTPDGPRLLQVVINGKLLGDPMEIASIPYALWSDTALHVAPASIDGPAIAPGSVQINHMADGFVEQFSSRLIDTAAFKSAISQEIGAGTIGISPTLTYSGSDTVQGALEDLDRAIRNREIKNVNLSGDTMTGPLKFSNKGVETLSIDPKNGQINGVDIKQLDHLTSEINNIAGVLHENKVDELIARDSEVKAITDPLKNITANINNLPGTLGASKIDSSIASDSEVKAITDPLISQVNTLQTTTANINSSMASKAELNAAINNESAARISADNQRLSLSGGNMSGNIDMGGNDLKGVGTVDGVNLDDEKSALNTDGSIKGGNYGAVSFKVSYNVKAGTALCNPDYIPTGFTTSECSMITFIPIISGFNGDGGGTETFNIFVEQGSYILNINADSRNTPDNKRNAIILAIGTKPGVEIFTQPDL